MPAMPIRRDTGSLADEAIRAAQALPNKVRAAEPHMGWQGAGELPSAPKAPVDGRTQQWPSAAAGPTPLPSLHSLAP